MTLADDIQNCTGRLLAAHANCQVLPYDALRLAALSSMDNCDQVTELPNIEEVQQCLCSGLIQAYVHGIRGSLQDTAQPHDSDQVHEVTRDHPRGSRQETGNNYLGRVATARTHAKEMYIRAQSKMG